MRHTFWRGLMALSILLPLAAAAAPAVQAAPPPGASSAPLAAGSPGYTLVYSFSADPKDNTYVASFTPDTKSILAWATITANNGAQEKQFQVDIQFIAPDGHLVKTIWYGSDDATVTSYPEADSTFGDANVARRELDVVGTPTAGLTGQWTVNFLADGKLVITGNFSLSDASDLAISDSTQSGRAELEAAGYTVTDFGQTTASDGTVNGYVHMPLESSDIYSTATSQQVVDGFVALRHAFPQADQLLDILAYNDRYDVVFYVDGTDADEYIKSQDFNVLSKAIGVDIFDKQANAYLDTGATDFINKNFGGGSPQEPLSPPLTKRSTVGSVRVEIKPSELPADGTSTAAVTVTVYDKRNKPLPNADIVFALSGSGSGTIRPRQTSSDDSGKAQATFTAGTGSGSVTVTATVSETIGTGVITLGSGGTDPAADNVISYLDSRGYKATNVGFADSAKTIAAVVLDLGTKVDVNSLGNPILYGLVALRQFYPTATKIAVMIPYQGNTFVFPSTAADFDAFGDKLDAAKTDAQKSTVIDDYLKQILGDSTLVDSNGNVVSSFNNFYDKNFAK